MKFLFMLTGGVQMISNYLGQGTVQQFQPELKDVTNIARAYGESGMMNYPVAPGNTVLLIDPDLKIGCLKATDITGRQLPIREFHYTEVNFNQTNNIVNQPQGATYQPALQGSDTSVINNQNESKNFEFNDFKDKIEKEVSELKESVNDIRKLLDDLTA